MNVMILLLVMRPMQNNVEVAAKSIARDVTATALPLTSAIPPIQFTLRLGPLLGPRFGYTAGLDAELFNLSMGPGWSTRFDGDLIWQPRGGALFDRVNTLFGATINQVYSFSRSQHSRWYFGGGIGGYGVPVPTYDEFGNPNYSSFYTNEVLFGGKLFLGSQFSRFAGAELGLNMVQSSRPLLTLQARLTF